MRPLRLLILLLAITLTLVLALVRPLQGRAHRPAKKQPKVKVHHHGRHEHAHGHKHGRHIGRLRHLRHLRHHTRRSHSHAHNTQMLGRRVAAYARHFLGVQYSWGGSSPRTGFDCSGLVRFVYGHFGIPLPHSTYGDLTLGHRVSRRWLRAGDLVFFSGASHVGIYVGGGRFIDAPHTGAVVRISTMQGWYGASYYGARRLAPS